MTTDNRANKCRTVWWALWHALWRACGLQVLSDPVSRVTLIFWKVTDGHQEENLPKLKGSWTGTNESSVIQQTWNLALVPTVPFILLLRFCGNLLYTRNCSRFWRVIMNRNSRVSLFPSFPLSFIPISPLPFFCLVLWSPYVVQAGLRLDTLLPWLLNS